MKHLFVLSFMLMSLMPSTILNAADTFTATTTEGVEMKFKVISESAKTAIVSSGQEDVPAIPVSTTGTVTIPQEVKGYRITGIGDEAFRETSLSAVSIPVGVSFVGGKAFAGCSNLSSVTLPEGMTSIGEEAFSESALSTIVLPTSLVRIGEQAFEGTRLTTITLPQNVAYLGNADRVDEETGELIVEDDLFADIFNGCSALTEVNVDAANKNYASINGILMTKDLKTLLYFPQAKTDNTIPSGVETIYCDAFADCSFSSITLPASITAIEEDAFDGCYQLSSIISEIMNPRAINHYAFSYSVYDQATLYVPAGTKALYEATDGWNLFQTIVERESETEPTPYAVLNSDSTVLTFYYDNLKDLLGGMAVDEKGWLENKESIISVVFDPSFANYTGLTSTAGWFAGCKNMKAIAGLTNLKTDNVTDMNRMFFCCSSLTSLDLRGFNTSRVRNMEGMFYECSSLTSLDLSSFNTENVTTMSMMFQECYNLQELNISSFNTQNVTSFFQTFLSCIGLTTLDLSHFNTVRATNMRWMFGRCSGLKTLDVSGFNTSNVTSMDEMFNGCTSLTSLDLKNFDTHNVNTMKVMFGRCSSLSKLDLSNFDTSNVEYIQYMFYGCVNLTAIYVGEGWTTDKVKEGDGMFDSCTKLVGGQGTTFDASHSDYTYAHIDGGTDNPGYLRDKNQQEQDEEQEKAIEEAKNELHAMIDAWRAELEYVYRMLTDKATREEAPELYAISEVIRVRLEDAEYRLVRITTLDEVEMLRKDVDDIGYQIYALFAEVDNFERSSTFTATTIEGVEMTFKVISEEDKTCQVGDGVDNNSWGSVAIDKSTTGSITIPEVVNGYTVIAIGTCAFRYCESLVEVTMPSSIEVIRHDAFSSCVNLQKADIPSSVREIGYQAFVNCNKITSVNLPEGIKTIEYNTFAGTKLSDLKIPNSVETIHGSAFNGGDFTSVLIPSGVKKITANPFMGCNNVTAVAVEEGNQDYHSDGNGLIETKTNKLISGFMSTSIPSYVKTIGESAFCNIDIQAFIIPEGVTSIDYYAFGGCWKLEEIEFPSTITSIDKNVLNKCRKLVKVTSKIRQPFEVDFGELPSDVTLYVPYGTKALYEATEGWNKFQNIVEMEPVEIEPLENGDVIDFGDFVDESGVEVLPALDGNVVGNLYFNILNDNGGYDAEEGCIVITESTADETIERIADKDFYDKELRETFTGIIFKVPAGSGNIKITAEALGSMLLKVRIGDDEPQSFELDGRQKVKIPYTVGEETLVYIYAGEDAAVKGIHPVTASSGMLRIFGIESESIPTTIADVETSDTPVTIYSVSGQRLAKPQKGINIIGGKKVVVK